MMECPRSAQAGVSWAQCNNDMLLSPNKICICHVPWGRQPWPLPAQRHPLRLPCPPHPSQVAAAWIAVVRAAVGTVRPPPTRTPAAAAAGAGRCSAARAPRSRCDARSSAARAMRDRGAPHEPPSQGSEAPAVPRRCCPPRRRLRSQIQHSQHGSEYLLIAYTTCKAQQGCRDSIVRGYRLGMPCYLDMSLPAHTCATRRRRLHGRRLAFVTALGGGGRLGASFRALRCRRRGTRCFAATTASSGFGAGGSIRCACTSVHLQHLQNSTGD